MQCTLMRSPPRETPPRTARAAARYYMTWQFVLRRYSIFIASCTIESHAITLQYSYTRPHLEPRGPLRRDVAGEAVRERDAPADVRDDAVAPEAAQHEPGIITEGGVGVRRTRRERGNGGATHHAPHQG